MTPASDGLERCLQPSYFIDSDSAEVRGFTERAIAGVRTERERAVRLYYAVRDRIRYDPYSVGRQPQDYRASVIVGRDAAFCIPKAILLAACARSCGIPARLGFADVRNHLTSDKLRATMNGVELLVFHGYTELHLDGAWRKVTPTFNRELCERFRVKPLDFDGRNDALMHPYDEDGRRHMEYVNDRGSFVDLPYDEMHRVLRETYGELPSRSTNGSDPEFAAAGRRTS